MSLELSAIYAQVMAVHLICGLPQDPSPGSPAEHPRVSKLCAGASMLRGSISQYAALGRNDAAVAEGNRTVWLPAATEIVP